MLQLILMITCIVAICMPDDKLVNQARLKPGQNIHDRAKQMKIAFGIVVAINVLSIIAQFVNA